MFKLLIGVGLRSGGLLFVFGAEVVIVVEGEDEAHKEDAFGADGDEFLVGDDVHEGCGDAAKAEGGDADLGEYIQALNRY